MIKFAKKHRNIILRFFDIIVIAIGYYIAEIIINNKIFLTPEMTKEMFISILLAILVYGGVLQIFKTYKNITYFLYYYGIF